MQHKQTAIGIAVLFGLLAAPLMGVAQPVSSDQAAAIAAATEFAPGAPHGEWTRINEAQPFFLAAASEATVCSGATLDYAIPTSTDCSVTGATSFAMPAGQTATRPVTMSALEVVVLANCVQDVANPVVPAIEISISGIDFVPGGSATPLTAEVESADSAPGSNTRTFRHTFTGTWDLPANTPLTVSIASANPPLPCTVEFGAGQSRLIITADSASLNLWPVDSEGAPIRSVPEPSRATPDKRNFGLDIAYASAWPCINDFSPCSSTPARDIMDARFDGSSPDLKVQLRKVDDQTIVDLSPTSTIMRPGTGSEDHADLAPSLQARHQRYTYGTALAEGAYRFEVVSSAGGSAQAPTLNVGGKGFEISSVDGQVHVVNPGEPTTFRIKALNVGSERDTVSFSFTKSGGAWDARLVNGQVTLEPNAEAEAILRVIPPANAIAGQALDITVTAISLFPNEVAAQTMQLQVQLQSAITRGADLQGLPSALDVSPGETLDIGGLRLHNTGTQVGTYVISTSFSPASPQWSATANPPSRTVDAASIDDFTMRLNVPVTAISGETKTLQVKATLLGESTPRITKNIDLTVIFTAGLDVRAAEAALTLRDQRAGTPVDSDFDRDAVYRLQLSNPTFVEQEFEVTANQLGCAWQAAWSESGPTFSGAARTMPAQSVTIDAQTTKEVYVKLGWITPSADCTRTLAQTMTLTFSTTNTNTNFPPVTQTLTATIVESSAATHVPKAEPGRAPGVDMTVPLSGIAVRNGSVYDLEVYDFRVSNIGNQFDSYLVEIPPAPKSGWSHTLHFMSGVFGDGSGAECTRQGSTERVYLCEKMGVGDHANFELHVRPNANVPLAQTLDTSLIVTSQERPGNKANLLFTTRTVGQLDHTSAALRSLTELPDGRDAALPFVIRNVGTQGDQFRVSLTGVTGDKPTQWSPRFASTLGSSQEITVPARSDLVSFLLVSDASGQLAAGAAGDRATFALQVESLSTGKRTTFSMDAQVVATGAGSSLSGDPTNNFLLPTRGAANEVTVKATNLPDGVSEVSFEADIDALPPGWEQAVAERTSTGTVSANQATATFQVTPPTNTLGTSQIPFRIKATPSGAGSTPLYVDLVLTLESEAGVGLRVLGDPAKFVPAGAPTTFQLEIVNEGLGQETINLASTPLPAGWVASFAATQVSVPPLTTQPVELDVFVPADARPRSNVTISLTASSGTASAQASVYAIVGFREIGLNTTAVSLAGAPEETLSFAVGVLNNGTLQDRLQFTATVVTPGYQDRVTTTVLPATADLLSDQGRDILVNVQLGPTVPPNVDITVRLVAHSLFAPATDPVSQTLDLTAHVLRYESRDVDSDLVNEYAVDRNQNVADGFEEFRDSLSPGGRRSVPADLQRFLASGTLSPIDGDGDGKIDHFVDHTGDGLPNAYWDPDNGHSMALTVIKDVNADGVVDYFVDTSGNGRIDRLYDVRSGAWTRVLSLDIDGDGTLDYAVDKNGNGAVDPDETVLFSRNGILVTVVKVDVDGDGNPDDVYDIDGDGVYDHFIRFGESDGRKITMRDVNGDGVADWTYDSNGDGRPDRYYDPQAQTGGHVIDTTQNFADLASRYWFVPALFLLVLVLFVVLVAVTRR